MQKTKTVKRLKKLTASERECLRALSTLASRHGDRIPSLEEIAREMGNVVQIAQVSKLRKSLEAKGRIRLRLEVLEKVA